MSLWTASEAAEATGGQAQGAWACNGVSIDTRTLQPGGMGMSSWPKRSTKGRLPRS